MGQGNGGRYLVMGCGYHTMTYSARDGGGRTPVSICAFCKKETNEGRVVAGMHAGWYYICMHTSHHANEFPAFCSHESLTQRGKQINRHSKKGFRMLSVLILLLVRSPMNLLLAMRPLRVVAMVALKPMTPE